MKTLKITEGTHAQLTEAQAYLYKKQGIKYTLNELIAWATAKALVTYVKEQEHDK